VNVRLNLQAANLVKQELERLRVLYGLELTPQDLVHLLLEQHRIKLQVYADTGQVSPAMNLYWSRRLYEEK